MELELMQSCPGWGPSEPCISGREESKTWCLGNKISVLILQLFMKIFNTGWEKSQQTWQLFPEMRKSVRIELDLPSANIKTLYGKEWKIPQVWKRKRNWVSLEVEVEEYNKEICSSITGSVKNKQYWKADERVCVCVIPVWFLQEKGVKSLSKV